jgi:hypothetical protein
MIEVTVAVDLATGKDRTFCGCGVELVDYAAAIRHGRVDLAVNTARSDPETESSEPSKDPDRA